MGPEPDPLEQLHLLLAKEKTARKGAEELLVRANARIAQQDLQLDVLLHPEKGGPDEGKWAEQLFGDVVDNLPGIVFQVQKNTDGTFAVNYVSPMLHMVLGERITNSGQLLRFMHPEDREKWLDGLEDAYGSAKPWKQGIRFLMPDGMLSWWYCSASPSRSLSGELLYNGIVLNTNRQKKAELELRENEKKWRFALEASGDGLWEYDVLADLTYYSPVSRELLGFDGGEYANDSGLWRKRIHPDDLPKVLATLKGCETGLAESSSIQYRALNKEGAYEWILDRGGVSARGADGRPTHYIGVHTNINKIKQVELELSSTATKLTTLITTMQDGIMLEDENNIVVLCNQAFCDIFEIPLLYTEIIGKNIETQLTRNKHRFVDIEEFRERRHFLQRNLKPASNEEIVLASGKFLSRDYNPLIIDGECKGHLWKYSDVTQSKKAEKALADAEKRYRGLIDNMEIGLIEYDPAENILYANPTFYKMSGFAKEELDGNIIERLLVKNRKEVAQQKMPTKNGVSDAYEVEIMTRTGEKKWWYVSVVFRQNDLLDTSGIIGACLDITGQKQQEHELRQAKQAAELADRGKDIFLANMSHEIRTPLNAVFGLSRLMEKTDLLPQQRFYLETMISSTSGLMVIINDILDHSKISAGKLLLERTGFRLPDLMSEIMNMLAYGAQKKGVQFLLHNSRCCDSVLMGDPFRLKQVLVNLLTNALKFTNNGSVLVNCSNMGLYDGTRQLNIQIKDTGMGMSEEFLKLLFEKYTQEDESIARSYSGTGLGMSISKQLVDLMGGTITVESKKDIGTTFDLDLYFEEGKESDILIDRGVRVDVSLLRDMHILVVEDNETNQLVVRTVLEQNGIKVSVASNGLEAIDMIDAAEFDLVLMDMQMPVMDGLQATAIIRKKKKAIPIIALTANALKNERQRCLDVGMDGFLAKPFEERELLELLCRWLPQNAKPVPEIFGDGTIVTVVPDSGLKKNYSIEKVQALSPGNTEFVEMVIRAFIEDVGTTVSKITNALKDRDYNTIKALTHRIRPSFDQFCIPYVAQLNEMEELCTTGDAPDRIGILVYGFEKITKEITADLKTVYGF